MFLSIIIPMYNTAEKYLCQCIDSCLEQDIDKSYYEIICINDGSTNNCLDILNKYKSKFDNIILISQINSGVSVARNAGIKIAKGDYIWFVDADDFIARNSLGSLHRLVSENKVDRLNLGAYHFVGLIDKSIDLKPNHTLRSIFCTRSLYDRRFLTSNNIIFMKEISLGEDMLFNFEIDQIKHTEAVSERVYYYYRLNEDSVTHNNDELTFAKKFIDSHLIACKVVKKYYNADKAKKLKTIRYLHSDISQTMIYISKLPFIEAKEYSKAILNNKLFPYIKWFSQGIVLGLYTNLYSFGLNMVCRVSTVHACFWIVKLWAKIWSSKLKKKIEKHIKKKLK